MSIGEKFATKNEVEVLRRKLQLALNGATIVQIEAEEIGVTNFTDLADVPSSYAATGNFAVRVNSTVDALEFAELKGTTNQVTVTANAADYTLSLPQDIHTAATPTFAGMYLQSASAAPFLKLTNESNTARDPIIQFAVGATPVTKFTMGVDDSDEDNWKLTNATTLGGSSSGFSFGDMLYYVHGGDDVVGVQLANFTLDAIYIVGGIGSGDGQFSNPRQIAFDGTYLYIADGNNNRIQKFLALDGSFILKTTANITSPWGVVYWNESIYVSSNSGTYGHTIRKFDAETMVFQSAFGSNGSGDNNFSAPRSMTTDGTYLYVCDTGNNRIKKHTFAGTYVAQVGSSGHGNGEFWSLSPVGIATNGIYLYACDFFNNRVQIFNCSDLSYVAQVAMQTRDGTVGNPASITLDGTYFYVGVHHSVPFDGYIEKYDIATNTFQAFYDTSAGAGNDPQTIWGSIVLKDEVILGDLIVAHQDGAFIDIYPKTRFLDSIRLYESSVISDDYVGIRAPSGVTSSYHLTLPTAPNAAKATPYASAGATLAWGQNVDTDGSPTFVALNLSATSNQIVLQSAGITGTITGTPSTSNKVWTLQDVTGTIYQTNGTDVAVADGGTGASALADGGLVIGNAAGAVEVVAAGTTTQILVGGGALTAPVWGTDIPTAVTIGGKYIYRADGTDVPVADGGTGKSSFTQYAIPYASAATTIGEIAIGAAGKVLAVNGTANGYEWIAAGGGGTFLSLTDVDEPNYTGHAGHFVVVDGDEDALVFSASSVAAHDILSITHGDTLASAVSVGSMIFGNATPKWAELNAGTEGQILEMGATLPGWGRTITISDSAASGGSNGDIWLEY